MTPGKRKAPAGTGADATTKNQPPNSITQAAMEEAAEHDFEMRRMAREIDWLEHHEHWWRRQLRWERERARGVAA